MSHAQKPIETDGIRIPIYLDLIVSKLAQHLHDSQAEIGRREHTPWHAMPEQQKIQDANAVKSLLKALLALGFTITPK